MLMKKQVKFLVVTTGCRLELGTEKLFYQINIEPKVFFGFFSTKQYYTNTIIKKSLILENYINAIRLYSSGI